MKSDGVRIVFTSLKEKWHCVATRFANNDFEETGTSNFFTSVSALSRGILKSVKSVKKQRDHTFHTLQNQLSIYGAVFMLERDSVGPNGTEPISEKLMTSQDSVNKENAGECEFT